MSNVLNTVLSSPIVYDVNYQQESPKTNSANLSFAKDSVSFHSLEMSENLESGKSSTNGCHILQGDINGQNSYLKVAYNRYGSDVEGEIQGKRILFSGKDGSIKGSYNNKDFELKYDNIKYHNKFGKRGAGMAPDSMTITGHINGEPINLQLPGSEVPKDADSRDIIVTLLASDYMTPFTVNGKIVKLAPSKMGSECAEYRYQADKDKFNNDVKPVLMLIPSVIVSTLIPLLIAKFTGGNLPK